MTGLPPRLPAAAPAAPQVSTKQYSMPAQTTNIAADTVEVQESAEQAQELLQADTSETRETEGAPPAEETAVEEEPMPETIQSTAGAQEGPQEFRVGDMVYRNGELASIAHVDHAVHPPCYVVRMAETGQEVGCEGQNLLPVYSQGTALAAGAPQTSPTEQVFTESTAGELPATVEGSADQGMAGQGTAPGVAFADAVHMQQHLQQMQYYNQMQMGHHLDPSSQGMYAHHMQQMQEFQQAQMQQMLQFQQQAQMQQQQQGWPPAHMYGDQFQNMYAQPMQMPPHRGGAPGHETFADQVQMQQYMMAQNGADPYQYAAACSSAPAAAPEENHALKALAEALDRAEIDMLLGPKKNRNKSSNDDLIGGFGMSLLEGRSHGDNFAMQGGSRGSMEPNFALQAASEALQAFDKPTSDNRIRLSTTKDPSSLLNDESYGRELTRGRSLPRSSALMHDLEAPTMSHPSAGRQQLVAPSFDQARELPRHDEFDHANFQTHMDQGLQHFQSHSMHSPPPALPEPQAHQMHSLSTEPSYPSQPPESCAIPSALDADGLILGFGSHTVPEDDDDEMELMAKQEMDEDDIIDFACRLPPKPPKTEVPPPNVVQPPLVPPLGPLNSSVEPPGPPPRCPPMSKPRGFSKNQKQKLNRRDFLIDCVINDDVAPRSFTPKKKTSSKGFHRGQPGVGGRGRSMPPCEVSRDTMGTAQPRSGTPQPTTPRGKSSQQTDGRSGGSSKDLKSLGISDDSPRRKHASATPALPMLEGRHAPQPQKSARGLPTPGSQSARSWRTRAAVGLYC